jgi:hypothetical protein
MTHSTDSIALCESIIEAIEAAQEVRDTLAAFFVEALISEEV